MKLGVTFRPPDTALSSVTVNVNGSPSLADASASVSVGASSSSRIVPFAVGPASTFAEVPEMVMPTKKASLPSSSVSSIVATVKVCVSSFVPVKVSAAVFSV